MTILKVVIKLYIKKNMFNPLNFISNLLNPAIKKSWIELAKL